MDLGRPVRALAHTWCVRLALVAVRRVIDAVHAVNRASICLDHGVG